MMDTTRSSSSACSGRISALFSGNRVEVSSTTRTGTVRGTLGLIVRKLATGTAILLLAIASEASRSTAA